MKKLNLILVFITLISCSVYAQYEFQVIKKLDATPIKSQDKTGTCWSFSTASFIESEMLRMGKSEVDLSEMFVVRNIYLEKALNYVHRQGKANFSQGSLGHDLLRVIGKYGIVPEEVYSGKLNNESIHNHSEMEAVLKAVLDVVITNKNGQLSDKWLHAVNGVLDAYLGKVPENFTYKGKTYTAKTFANEIVGINPADYVEITSYTHYPFYKQFVLDIPDNFSNGLYHNVPMEEMEAITEHALQSGYTVTWDCDVSEKGFSAQNGVAILPEQDWSIMSKEQQSQVFESPSPEKKVSQALRQQTFEDYSTTDDHLMHITGMAKDQKGNLYYIVKNSWGRIGKFDGYLYTSKRDFQLKTVSILVHKNAIPKDIAKKMGI